MLAICDRRGDERVPVCDTYRLGEVDHLVGDVLLVADTARGQKRVEASQARELHARLVREYIAAADELFIIPLILVRWGKVLGNVHRGLASSARRQGGRPARCADSEKDEATLGRAIAACGLLGLWCQR